LRVWAVTGAAQVVFPQMWAVGGGIFLAVWRYGQDGRHEEELMYGSADRGDLEGSRRRTARL